MAWCRPHSQSGADAVAIEGSEPAGGPVGLLGMGPSADLARRCLDTVLRLTTRIHHNPRPLGTVKNAAYAWRQMLFFLSLSTWEEQEALPTYAEQQLVTQPDHVRARLAPAVTGLAHVINGGKFDPDGRAGTGQRLLGWTTTEHWMLDPGLRD